MIKIYDIQAFEAMYDHTTFGYDPKVEGFVFSIMQWGRQVTDVHHVDKILAALDLHRLDSPLLVSLVHALVHHSQWLTEWPDFVNDVKDHLNQRGEYRLADKVDMYLGLCDHSE